MAQAIITKFVGPTNTRGARIIAKTGGGLNKETVSWNYEAGVEDNHREAAQHLMETMGWTGELIGGGLVEGYAWVIVNR